MEQIPSSFAQFYALKPSTVRQFILREGWAPYFDYEDLEQHLLAELLRKQVVEKFDPAVYGTGLDVRHFYSYVKECCRRIVYTVRFRSKIGKELAQTQALSMDAVDEDGGDPLSSFLADDGRSQRAIEAGHELAAFYRYVTARQPELEPLLCAIATIGSTNRRELAEVLGTSHSSVQVQIMQLNKLAERWQRKPRKARNNNGKAKESK